MKCEYCDAEATTFAPTPEYIYEYFKFEDVCEKCYKEQFFHNRIVAYKNGRCYQWERLDDEAKQEVRRWNDKRIARVNERKQLRDEYYTKLISLKELKRKEAKETGEFRPRKSNKKKIAEIRQFQKEYWEKVKSLKDLKIDNAFGNMAADYSPME